jgi:TolB-like protein/Flp pilus assembly protein TadD
MTIWSSEIKELETLLASIQGQFPDLEKELEQLIETKDANVILIYSRRCLEVIITDLCENELKRPRKTEPLKGIIDKLSHEDRVPSHIVISMQYLNSLSTFGAHPKDFDPEQVKPVLSNLAIIIKWYLKYKEEGGKSTRVQEVGWKKAQGMETQERGQSEMDAKHKGYKETDHISNIWRKPSKVIIGILIVAAVVVVTLFALRGFGSKKQTGELEKSIAVLPFVNDSPDEENAYFINGIMDEILINLQTIKELRVISRTSVERYRGPDKPSIPQIARELGVNYIVEGSGQKYGNTISLRVQLLKAAKESHLWAESYKQEINEVNDILSIQGQIAQSIATELETVITPQEENTIRRIPTENPLAYDYYLKGKQYRQDVKWDLAIDMFGKAIEQDPGFALAYLARASICSRLYFTKGTEYRLPGTWEGYDSLAKADLKMAMRINPELPEVKYAQAEQLYWFDRKHNEALELLDQIKNQMGNNPSFFFLKSAILRRTGQWEESLNEMRHMILLDPLNPEGYIEAGHTCRMMRRFPEAIELYDKSLLLDQNPENLWGKIDALLLWKGDPDSAMNLEEMSEFGYNSYLVSNYYYFKRQFDKLIAITGKSEDQFKYFPKSLNLAIIYFLEENIRLCRQYADSAIADIIPKIKESPGDDRYYAALGYAYAFKGENKKAIENAQKAVKLKPLKMDAWQGFEKELDLAKVYILAGEYDLAMDKIELLLTIPGELSVPMLKIDPAYDKLRTLERFQKILMTEYKTNY